MADKLLPNQFRDVKGETWTLVITVGNARRARQTRDVDLLNYQAPVWLERLAIEPELAVDLCGLFADPSPSSKGLDEFTFADRFNGDIVAAAMVAIKEAWFSFSPAEIRPALRALDKKAGQGMQMAFDQAASRIGSAATDKRLAKWIAENCGEPAGDGEEPPGSNSGD